MAAGSTGLVSPECRGEPDPEASGFAMLLLWSLLSPLVLCTKGARDAWGSSNRVGCVRANSPVESDGVPCASRHSFNS